MDVASKCISKIDAANMIPIELSCALTPINYTYIYHKPCLSHLCSATERYRLGAHYARDVEKIAFSS